MTDCCQLVKLVQRKNYTGVKNAVSAGAKINCLCKDASRRKFFPLLVACQKNDLKMVDLLLELGADPDYPATKYTGPFHITKSGPIAKRLIGAGADLNLKSSDGYAPIHSAIRHLDVLKVLVEAGADLEARDKIQQRTALEKAIDQHLVKSAIYLIDKGASADTPNDWGQTIFLHVAGNTETTAISVVKALLKNKKRLLQRNVHGMDAILSAAARANNEMVKLLLDAGADVNSKNSRNETPISFAIRYDNEKLSRLLLSYGADLGVPVGGRDPIVADKTCRELAAESKKAGIRKLVADFDAKQSKATKTKAAAPSKKPKRSK